MLESVFATSKNDVNLALLNDVNLAQPFTSICASFSFLSLNVNFFIEKKTPFLNLLVLILYSFLFFSFLFFIISGQVTVNHSPF